MFGVFNHYTAEWINKDSRPQYNLTIDQIIENIKDGEYDNEDPTQTRIISKYGTASFTIAELKDFIDPKTKTAINITEDHIEKGLPGHSEACPLALALEEEFPQCFPTVDIDIEFSEHERDEKTILRAGPSITKFIQTFDVEKTAPTGTLYLGEEYAWFVEEGDNTPYETLVREIQKHKSESTQKRTDQS